MSWTTVDCAQSTAQPDCLGHLVQVHHAVGTKLHFQELLGMRPRRRFNLNLFQTTVGQLDRCFIAIVHFALLKPIASRSPSVPAAHTLYKSHFNREMTLETDDPKVSLSCLIGIMINSCCRARTSTSVALLSGDRPLLTAFIDPVGA